MQVKLYPLSGRGKAITYESVPSKGKVVNWGSLKFYLTDEIIDKILNNFFVDFEKWYSLGASFDNPIEGGLGEFITQVYKQFTPRHASAIDAIMVNEHLITYKGKKPIELKKI